MSNPAIHKGMTSGIAQSHQRNPASQATSRSKTRKIPPPMTKPRSERNFPESTAGKSVVRYIAAIHALISRTQAAIGLITVHMRLRVMCVFQYLLSHVTVLQTNPVSNAILLHGLNLSYRKSTYIAKIGRSAAAPTRVTLGFGVRWHDKTPAEPKQSDRDTKKDVR